MEIESERMRPEEYPKRIKEQGDEWKSRQPVMSGRTGIGDAIHVMKNMMGKIRICPGKDAQRKGPIVLGITA